VYEAIGLQWIPPELRETGVEIGASRAGALPRLVRYEDLQGCFHCHTVFSDGRATVDAMAEAALERGWRYLGIADHSQFASYAGGLSPQEIIEQHGQIDAWNARSGDRLWLFKGIEADVLADGRVDYDDQPELLARFDYVVASVHSSFALERGEQTRRVERAMQNPYVTFMGHLTGRLLLIRRGYELDMDEVFAAAAEQGVSIEINSDPRRMELDWRYWRDAKSHGIRTAINPDAHSPAQLDFVHNGINVARKGWLETADIVNCWPLERVQTFLREARAR
jgi:DNA polymerase (family 10)